jgi:hypothetical protein
MTYLLPALCNDSDTVYIVKQPATLSLNTVCMTSVCGVVRYEVNDKCTLGHIDSFGSIIQH